MRRELSRTLLLAAIAVSAGSSHARALTPDDFYGVHVGNDTDIGASIKPLRTLGARWVRLWCNVTWTDQKLQSVFRSAVLYKAAGFKVIFLLAHDGGTAQPVPDYATVKAYCSWVLGRDGMRDAVDIWEICNELNLSKYWPGTPVQYVDNVLKAAWDVFHAAGEPVLGGSSTAWQTDASGKSGYGVYYFERLRDAGYLTYCDYAGTHPYTERASEMIAHVRAIRAVYGSKPLIASEWNLKQMSNDSAWAAQLDRARDSLAGALSIACFYRFLGFSSEGGWPGLVQGSNYTPTRFFDMYVRWPKQPLPEPSDKVPPSVPAGLKAAALSAGQVGLSWNRSTDNAAVLAYSIYRNDAFVQIATDTTAINGSKVAANTLYSYRVAAFDAAGNVSSKSPAVTVRTPGAYSPLPQADAYVSAAEPDRNFGTVWKNVVKGAPGYDRVTYLRFSMHYAPAGAATLRLTVTDLGSESSLVPRLEIRAVAQDSWDESGITWNSRPAPGPVIASAAVTAPGPIEFDLTSHVAAASPGDSLLSLCIVDGAGANRSVSIGSRENNDNRPTLTITPAASAVRVGHSSASRVGGSPPAPVDLAGRVSEWKPARRVRAPWKQLPR